MGHNLNDPNLISFHFLFLQSYIYGAARGTNFLRRLSIQSPDPDRHRALRDAAVSLLEDLSDSAEAQEISTGGEHSRGEGGVPDEPNYSTSR